MNEKQYVDFIVRYGTQKGIYFAYIDGIMDREWSSQFEEKFLVPVTLMAFIELKKYRDGK